MKKKWFWSGLLVFCFSMLFLGCKKVEAATKIHYIGLKSSTDAILLECDGRFALVDSGEDWDYPKGDNPMYPLRKDIVTNKGYEQQVIYYMKSVGVTSSNLDFYIGTHAHSDHIGSGDEIVEYFKPKKVYLKEYSDARITKSNRRWDNLYIYNTLLEAAARNGAEVIQNLTEGMEIKLGSAVKIQLYNTKLKSKVEDENENSLVAKVKIYGVTTLLTGDLTPETAWDLIAKKKIGKTDILKLPHHGYYDNNKESLIMKYNAKTTIVTGPLTNIAYGTDMAMKGIGTKVFTTNTDTAAVVTQYSAAGASTQTKKISAGWFTYKGNRYYFDKNGRVSTGWKKISEKWYYFNKQGKAVTGWLTVKNKAYYLAKTKTSSQNIGQMLTGWQLINGEAFYFRKASEKGVEGEMLTGWQRLGGKDYYLKKTGNNGVKGKALTGQQILSDRTYYFSSSQTNGVRGSMQTGWQVIDNKRFYFKKTGTERLKGSMLIGWHTLSGNRYYFKKTGSKGTKGRVLTDWQVLSDKTYYFSSAGKMQTGWQTVNSISYYFDEKGVLFDIQCRTTEAATQKQSAWERIHQYNARDEGQTEISSFALQMQAPMETGNLTYRSCYNSKWEKSWRVQGQESGDSQATLQAVQMKLTGNLLKQADLYYRVYLKDYGWLGWTANGEIAGAPDGDYKITQIQIQIRQKGAKAPINTTDPVLKAADQAIDQATLQELKTLIGEVENLDQTQYTQDSWELLLEALDAMNGLNLEELKQEEASRLLSQLKSAYEGLQVIEASAAPSADPSADLLPDAKLDQETEKAIPEENLNPTDEIPVTEGTSPVPDKYTQKEETEDSADKIQPESTPAQPTETNN